jgi:hypothetical protein
MQKKLTFLVLMISFLGGIFFSTVAVSSAKSQTLWSTILTKGNVTISLRNETDIFNETRLNTAKEYHRKIILAFKDEMWKPNMPDFFMSEVGSVTIEYDYSRSKTAVYASIRVKGREYNELYDKIKISRGDNFNRVVRKMETYIREKYNW